MNNRGFTVTQMIIVTCIGMLFLVIAGIIYQNNIQNIAKPKVNEPQVDSDTIDTNPTLEDDVKDYSDLEIKIKTAIQEYIQKNSSNNQEVFVTIKLETLISDGYLEKIVDPNDETIECRGYGLYKVTNNQYQGYLRCPGNYATENYNPEFE